MSAVAATATELGPYAGLGHRFGVRCDHPGVAAYLEAAFATLADPAADSPPGWYALSGIDDRLDLTYDGEVLAEDASARRAVGMLTWHVNRCAIDSATADHVVVHAAALARDGHVLMLPAAMEAGKTTLAAGLIDRGWAYLSDEAAALTRDGRRVRAYPKPLSVDPGSQHLLDDWAPPVPADAPSSLRAGQWQVPATSRAGGRVVADGPLGGIVLPRYEQGAETRLTPLARAVTVARVATCVFAWQGPQLRWRFEALASAVRRSRCAELVVGDLDAACATIERWWEEGM